MNELVKIDVSFEYAPKVYVYEREGGWYWKFKLPNDSWFYGPAAGDNRYIAKRNGGLKERELAKGLFTQKEVDRFQRTSSQMATFAMAIDDFVEHLKSEGASPNYFKRIESQLKTTAKFFEQTYKVKYVYKVSEDDAYKYRKHLLLRVRMDEISRPTAFRTLNDVKRLFKWLKRRKRIPQNPWVEIDPIVVPREEKARSAAPTKEVLTQLMAANYSHRYGFPIKEFAYGLFRTGARLQELLFLEVDDVDWDTGLWVIRKKTCPNKHGMDWAPKYGKTRETVIPKDVLLKLGPLVKRALRHKVVGYAPGRQGKMRPVEAGFIFTMVDRVLSKTTRKPVYRRVDSVRAAWGALFVAAGLVEPSITESSATSKYKDGKKVRTDVGVPFTRHDMRRGFNIEARDAGMSLDERALILGHGREVNENHYCGKPRMDAEKIAEIMNNKMWSESDLLTGAS